MFAEPLRNNISLPGYIRLPIFRRLLWIARPQSGAAHSAKAELRIILVTAAGAADVHRIKHRVSRIRCHFGDSSTLTAPLCFTRSQIENWTGVH